MLGGEHLTWPPPAAVSLLLRVPALTWTTLFLVPPRPEAGVVVPDELLFSVLLRAHGAKSPPLWSDMSKLLGQMKHTFGVSPTAITYNVLLEVCAVTNDYDRGCQLIDRMVEEGVEPNAFTLAAVSTRKSLRSYLKRGL